MGQFQWSQYINDQPENGASMTDKFKPLNHNPRWVYGAEYWNIVAKDTFEFSWNSLILRFG